MRVTAYIDAVWEFAPALAAAGYELGDYNPLVPAIHLRLEGSSTYVRMDDVDQLEQLIAEPPID